mgnify:CR=1 FL=1
MARRDTVMQKPKNARGALRRLIAFLGPFRWLILLVAVLCVVSNLLSLWGPNLAGSAINEAAAGKGKVNFDRVYYYAMRMLFCYLSSSLLTVAIHAIMVWISKRAAQQMRQQVFDKLRGLGVACECDEIVTSGYVAALYAQREGLQDIYLCGSEHLAREFEALGVAVVDAQHARNLLIGYDPAFDYAKLTQAVRVALRAQRIIACNKEKVFQGEGAQWFPGCGGMVAPIEWCAGRTSDYVIGKPNTLMLEMVASTLGLSHEELLVVGDTYESDILMANRFGCQSVLISSSEYSDTVSVAAIGELVHLLH